MISMDEDCGEADDSTASASLPDQSLDQLPETEIPSNPGQNGMQEAHLAHLFSQLTSEGRVSLAKYFPLPSEQGEGATVVHPHQADLYKQLPYLVADEIWQATLATQRRRLGNFGELRVMELNKDRAHRLKPFQYQKEVNPKEFVELHEVSSEEHMTSLEGEMLLFDQQTSKIKACLFSLPEAEKLAAEDELALLEVEEQRMYQMCRRM
jgi:hypothetical protein